MKKVVLSVVTAISIAALSGCQLTGSSETPDLTNADFNTMDCDQIEQLFTDYKSNMETLDSGSSILSAVGMDTGTAEAKATMRAAYNQAATTVRPVLKAKSCTFTV
ncbi:hypothetical protein [Vibrio fluvialis]|uniref:hypothetical protein n=1 Tax=Vibrio fluvialis TaxID=676 RepID=UPI003D7CE0D2